MPDDETEDTATGTVPRGRAPADEEWPTAITAAPPPDAEGADGDDGPTGVARAPVDERAASIPRPPSDDNPTAIARAPSEGERSAADDYEGPTSISRLSDVLASPDEAPTGVAPMPPEAEAHDDSIVTMQKGLPESGKHQKLDKHDIYDVDDDRTERRDLPVEEIKRAIQRAKNEPVNITEAPDEAPTAKRRGPSASEASITPRTGVQAALPLPRPAVDAGEEDDDDDLHTETDHGATIRRAAAENAVRPPFASEADQLATEPRLDKQLERPAVPRSTNLMHTMPLPPRPAPPKVDPPDLASDSYTFKGGAGALQAVIPVGTSANRAINAPPPSPASSGPRLPANSGPLATQSLGVQPAPSFPTPRQQLAAPPYSQPGQPAAPPYSQPGQPAAQPYSQPGQPSAQPPLGPPPSSGLHALPVMPALAPTLPPPPRSGSGPASSPRLSQGAPFPPPPLGGAQGGYPTGQLDARARTEEPRWIVLVLAVLAICLLIPVVLYVVLRSRADGPQEQQPPVKSTVTVQTAEPRDVGKRR